MAIIAEKLYTIESLIQYTQERIKAYVQKQASASPTDNEYKLKRIAQDYLQNCHCGDETDKLFVKQMMRRMITEVNGAESENFPAGYSVDPSNVDKFIPWDNYKAIDPYILFLAVLQRYKQKYDANALGHIIEKYKFNDLRPRGGLEGPGFFIDKDDVVKMWEAEKLDMSFEAKVEVILQLVYEETYGNSCIDEILYQNVGDISAGVSGIPGSISLSTLDYGEPAYNGCWVRYKGCSIHMMFVTFGSNERLKEVVKQIVDYQMKGQFSEKEGFKLGYGKDGSRRTAAIEPFGESPALWVRKFTEQAATNEDLYGGIPGSEQVADIERCLVRGGATIPICGAQGSGKTTKLETLAQYIQNFYSIRVLESEFEARLRWKYPMKNIYTMEANDTTPVSPAMAYNFSLRSAGDIYIIGEARSDDMIINVTRTANRGGRSVLFTFHPKTAAMTIPEIANAMIREKMYTNLKDAVATALNTVKVCIYVDVDIETHKHTYEVFEFVPRPNLIPDDFMRLTDPDERDIAFKKAVHAWMQTMASADIYYDTVPIITFDRVTEEYVMRNTISDNLFNELMTKTPRREERLDLMRVFRPSEFIRAKAHDEQAAVTPDFERKLIEKFRLNTCFMEPTARTEPVSVPVAHGGTGDVPPDFGVTTSAKGV